MISVAGGSRSEALLSRASSYVSPAACLRSEPTVTSLNIFRRKVGFELALSWVGTFTSGTLLSWMPNYALERCVTRFSEYDRASRSPHRGR